MKKYLIKDFLIVLVVLLGFVLLGFVSVAYAQDIKPLRFNLNDDITGTSSNGGGSVSYYLGVPIGPGYSLQSSSTLSMQIRIDENTTFSKTPANFRVVLNEDWGNSISNEVSSSIDGEILTLTAEITEDVSLSDRVAFAMRFSISPFATGGFIGSNTPPAQEFTPNRVYCASQSYNTLSLNCGADNGVNFNYMWFIAGEIPEVNDLEITFPPSETSMAFTPGKYEFEFTGPEQGYCLQPRVSVQNLNKGLSYPTQTYETCFQYQTATTTTWEVDINHETPPGDSFQTTVELLLVDFTAEGIAEVVLDTDIISWSLSSAPSGVLYPDGTITDTTGLPIVDEEDKFKFGEFYGLFQLPTECDGEGSENWTLSGIKCWTLNLLNDILAGIEKAVISAIIPIVEFGRDKVFPLNMMASLNNAINEAQHVGGDYDITISLPMGEMTLVKADVYENIDTDIDIRQTIGYFIYAINGFLMVLISSVLMHPEH